MTSWISCLPSAVALLLIASSLSPAAATSYTVGDGSGWTTGVDYTSWAASKNFKVGDNLVFNYAKGLHTVVEVSPAEYMACTATQPMGSDSSGATTIPLKTPGSHYFICSIPGHCSAGMKLTVAVGGSSSPASPTPTTPTRSPNTNTPYTNTPTPTTPYTNTPTPTTPYTNTPTTTTPYTTTPTSPACTGGSTGNPLTTPTTPGMTPFTSYPSASGIASAGLAVFSLVWFAIAQLALLA